jgi:3-oxoacyl-[acyl-carrier protein] reductase
MTIERIATVLLELTGKRALVTGASRGIGKATADLLAQEGCSLAICARGEKDLFGFADELRSRGVTVHAEAFDVSAEGAIGAFVDRSAAALGGLDILISNVTGGSVKGEGQWLTSLGTDLLPLVRAIDAAVPHFVTAGGGAVVAISSISGVDTASPSAPNSYAAMKAAVIQHSSARAHALAAQGIRVNTVSPGPIDFPGGDWDRVREGRPALYEQIKEKIALGRYGRPEEVAKAITYLASPAASFCTGVNLVVDGGMLSRVQF